MRPDFPAVVDNSLLNEFRSCPQKAFKTYFQHWKPTGESVHLHAGKAFASGLESARRAYYEAQQPASVAVAHGLETLLQEYGDFSCPDDSAKSAIRMAQALEYYFDAWPLDSDLAQPLSLPSGRRAIEFSFVEPLEVKHPVTGLPILYSGRADMIASYNGGNFVEDDKTASQLGASWANQWDLRSQFTGYTWAARQAGIPVDGVLVRGVAILKTSFKHEQCLTFRAKWEVDRWLEQTHRDLQRMIRSWEEGYFDYNLGEACGSYGGCHFRQICKAQNPEEWLGIYFHRKRWDPVRRVEELIND